MGSIWVRTGFSLVSVAFSSRGAAGEGNRNQIQTTSKPIRNQIRSQSPGPEPLEGPINHNQGQGQLGAFIPTNHGCTFERERGEQALYNERAEPHVGTFSEETRGLSLASCSCPPSVSVSVPCGLPPLERKGGFPSSRQEKLSP